MQQKHKFYPRASFYPPGKEWVIETGTAKFVFATKSTAEYSLNNWR